MSLDNTPTSEPKVLASLIQPPRPEYNGMAIAAFILLFIFPPLGIAFGIIATKQIRRSGERGNGLALFSIIFGAVVTFMGLVVVVISILFAVYLVGAVEKTSLDVNDLDAKAVQTLTETATAVAAAQKSGALDTYTLPTKISGPAAIGEGPNSEFSVPRDYTVFLYENGGICVQFIPEGKGAEADQGWWHVFPGDETPREWGCPPLSVGDVRL